MIDKIHEQFEALKKIFGHLKYEYSKGCEIPSSEIYNLLVDTLNGDLFNMDTCIGSVEKIYFSHDSNSNYVVTIMPITSLNDIVFEDTISKSADPKKKYYLEISLDALTLYSDEELAIWFIHEFVSNLFTEFTNNRIRKRLIDLYDKTKIDIHSFNAPKSIANYLLYCFYSNTFKTIITDNSDDVVSITIKDCGYTDIWNSALNKFVSENGGNPAMLDYNNIVLSDNCVLYTVNQLNRKYLTNQLKFKDRLYKIFAKGESVQSGSSLLYDLIFKVPDGYILTNEPNSFIYFDDRRICLESVGLNDNEETLADIKISDVNNKVDDISKLSKAVETDDEKLVIISKINNLIKFIECMKDNRDKCSDTIKSYNMTSEFDNNIYKLNTIKENIKCESKY